MTADFMGSDECLSLTPLSIVLNGRSKECNSESTIMNDVKTCDRHSSPPPEFVFL